MKEEEELVKAKQKLSCIIEKYGSLELLRKEYNLYQKSAKEGNKEAAADIRKIERLKKKIQVIEERNGILKDKEASKYKDHCKKVMSIIGKYKFLNVLKDKRKMYRKSKKRKYKEASYDLNKYYNNMKKMRRYE